MKECINKYVCYPESKFRWATGGKKQHNLFPNQLYCHLIYTNVRNFSK
jgi:hypothetical protein